jgi:hypothetical protein
LTARITRWRAIRGGERNGLRRLAGRIQANDGEFCAANEKNSHASFGAIPEGRSIENAIGGGIDELAFDANRHNGKTGGAEGSAREGEEAHFVFIGDAGAGRKNELRGRFGNTDAEKRGIGVVGQNEAARYHFVAESGLPFLGSIGGEAGIQKKHKAEGAMKIGDGGDAVGKLVDGVVEGGGVGGRGECEEEEAEEEKTRKARCGAA